MPRPIELPTRPDPRIRSVWMLRGLGMAIVYAAFLAMFLGFPLRFVLLGDPGDDASAASIFLPILWVWLGLIAVVWLLIALYAHLAVARYSFEVGEEDVTVRKGVVFRTTTRIPLRRVQDIHVRQGPLLRAYGLASIKLETAGMSGPTRYGHVGLHSEGQLPGLRDAEAVAQEIMRRVKSLKGDV